MPEESFGPGNSEGFGAAHILQEGMEIPEALEVEFRFPPADLIFGPEGEGSVEALKRTFSRPTKDGIAGIFNDLREEGEDIPEEVSIALSEWLGRSWWEWYDEEGVENPNNYEAEAQKPNPLCTERGAQAAIQELLIRAMVKGRELSPLEQEFVKELLRMTSESYAAYEQSLDARVNRLADASFEIDGIADSGLHPDDWAIYQEYGRLSAVDAVTDKRDACNREKGLFALLKEKGVPAILSFFRRYNDLGEKGRVDMRDNTIASPRDISILVKTA